VRVSPWRSGWSGSRATSPCSSPALGTVGGSYPSSRTPPGNLADLWWRLYIPELRSVTGSGYALGIDDTGDLDFFGPAEPGSSGSGLIDQHGELVGVVTRTFNPFQVTQRSLTSRRRLEVVEDSVKVLALSSATPINDWPRPR
jgi:hypothetical protein